MKSHVKLISHILIITLFISTLSIPVMANVNSVDAATKKVTVMYKSNGGKFSAKKYVNKKTVNKKIVKGKKLGKTPKITNPGYKFKGWYNKKTGGKKYNKTKKINKKTTLYARWQANTYTITFNENNNTTANIVNKQIKYNTSYSQILYTPAKAGYDFVGWYNASGVKVDKNNKYQITGNSTLYARWVEKTYTVIFNENNDSENQQVEKNIKYNSVLYKPTRENYYFAGWYTSSGTRVGENGKYQIADNSTLYARWISPKKYQGLIDAMGMTEDEVVAEYPYLIKIYEDKYKTDYISLVGREKWRFTPYDVKVSYFAKVEDVFGDIDSIRIEDFGNNYIVDYSDCYESNQSICYYLNVKDIRVVIDTNGSDVITKDMDITIMSNGVG